MVAIEAVGVAAGVVGFEEVLGLAVGGEVGAVAVAEGGGGLGGRGANDGDGECGNGEAGASGHVPYLQFGDEYSERTQTLGYVSAGDRDAEDHAAGALEAGGAILEAVEVEAGGVLAEDGGGTTVGGADGQRPEVGAAAGGCGGGQRGGEEEDRGG